jgi:hypothetical protein
MRYAVHPQSTRLTSAAPRVVLLPSIASISPRRAVNPRAGADFRKLARRRSVMAALDWSQCPAVESIPGKISGAWVFRGTRTPVAVFFENLEDGDGRRGCGEIPRDPVKHVGS